nr:unnamed protein product [Callosobruchus analis]
MSSIKNPLSTIMASLFASNKDIKLQSSNITLSDALPPYGLLIYVIRPPVLSILYHRLPTPSEPVQEFEYAQKKLNDKNKRVMTRANNNNANKQTRVQSSGSIQGNSSQDMSAKNGNEADGNNDDSQKWQFPRRKSRRRDIIYGKAEDKTSFRGIVKLVDFR